MGQALGPDFAIHYLRLPQHGKNILDYDFQLLISEFSTALKLHLTEDSSIIAYSLGASYLQYYLERQGEDISLASIIYLSPALKTKINLKIFCYLPHRWRVPSFSPKEFRLRNFCYSGDYKILYLLTKDLALTHYPFIIADPRDELIDLSALKFKPLQRELAYGEHHLSFHPKYFTRILWGEFIQEIRTRLLGET